MTKTTDATALTKLALLGLIPVVIGLIATGPASAHHRPDHTPGGKPTASPTPTPEPTPSTEPDPTPVVHDVVSIVHGVVGVATCPFQVFTPGGFNDVWSCLFD